MTRMWKVRSQRLSGVVFGRDPTPPVAVWSQNMAQGEEPLDEEGETTEGESPLQYAERTHQALQQVHDFVRAHQQLIAERMKERYDRNRPQWTWDVGSLVLMSVKAHPRWRESRKQEERFYGPYIIQGHHGPNAVRLGGLPRDVPPVVNVSFLKPFIESPPEFEARPTADVNIPEVPAGDTEPEWELEAIEATQVRRGGKRYFKVKVEGISTIDVDPDDRHGKCTKAGA